MVTMSSFLWPTECGDILSDCRVFVKSLEQCAAANGIISNYCAQTCGRCGKAKNVTDFSSSNGGWVRIDPNRSHWSIPRHLDSMVYHTLIYMLQSILCRTLLYFAVLWYSSLSFSSLLYSSLPFSSTLHCTALLSSPLLSSPLLLSPFLYSTPLALYCTVLYCAVLHCTVLYRTVPYRTIPYRTVLYRTVPYHTVFYCTVLCCTVILLYYFLFDLIWLNTFVVLPHTIHCTACFFDIQEKRTGHWPF